MAASIIALRVPVQLGEQGELVRELTLKPSARAFRDFSMPLKDDGTILFQPYALAAVGVKLAGQPPAFLDRMDPADMVEVAQAVMGFIGAGLGTGTAR